ncbi:class I SAM-dependent methyltransferase [Winogradskyella luteola]|uniref:Class I SAM-dependent methyltransferase n=1 Tax=Winogradskyella luteola TaxID=2828330 RepID=A0A9X1F8S9_9FLAO|nr:class I SAM-dependent methyltransferase [Winogradskyella luteola]MBV7269416.1 class I SAM-dependent methyltransferase [Winogradskyella luteola]
MKKQVKTPWPTQAVMQQVYEKHLWGGKGFDFYSGEGSHNPTITEPYLKAVLDFLKSENNKLTVCDLGCGDFNIGKHFVAFSKKYIAIDIVESLIKRNQALFKADNLEFHCLDISKDKLPKADCIILRQVLQHLSNTEIKCIVNKLSSYQYIILTEHLPIGDFVPNKDKIASQGIRLKQNSGVDLLAEPFVLKVKSTEILNEVVLDNNKGRIVTNLYEVF